MLESFDAPLATDELGFSIANHMERLELIADAAAKEGDRKTEDQCNKGSDPGNGTETQSNRRYRSPHQPAAQEVWGVVHTYYFQILPCTVLL